MAEVTALLLAGGRSRRFGSDKAAASFRGLPMARRALEAASSVFPRVLLVSRSGERHAYLGLPLLRDLLPEPHPLGGVWSAFRQDHAEAYCVLACDAPLVRPELLRLLRDGLGDKEAAFCRWEGRLQPFPCLMTRRAAERIEPAPDGSLPSFQSLAAGLDARIFTEAETSRADPEGESFRDADTPEALARLEAHAY